TVADLDHGHLLDVHDLHGLDRVRETPAQTGLGHVVQRPEAQHHAALALLYHVEAAEQPQAESDRDEEADAEARTAAPAEQPRQPALEVAHQLVEIRRRAAAPAP